MCHYMIRLHLYRLLTLKCTRMVSVNFKDNRENFNLIYNLQSVFVPTEIMCADY